MGTELLRLDPQAEMSRLVRWVLERPADVRGIHRAYREAGAQLLTTHTLMAWREPDAEKLVERAVQLCREAEPVFVQSAPVTVAASLGPGASKQTYRDLASVARDAGADLLQLETFIQVSELARAVEASANELPIVALLVPGANGRTLGGNEEFNVAGAALVEAGAAAIGLNCASPAVMQMALPALRVGAGNLPLVFRPSANNFAAGAGVFTDSGELASYTSPVSWVDAVYSLIDSAFTGDNRCFLGGCCGAGPSFIKALATRLHS